mmetsp:Transcript_46995/g.102577  ORF Transcript_46995/g.102577 Transcript_46995/m.102577 type:complete len:113 (+) Transcript_46995:21-359(+)
MGFDVLIDAALEPWVLEVNLSPSMNTDTQVDFEVKANLITDTFRLIALKQVSEKDVTVNHSSNLISNFNSSSISSDLFGDKENSGIKDNYRNCLNKTKDLRLMDSEIVKKVL